MQPFWSILTAFALRLGRTMQAANEANAVSTESRFTVNDNHRLEGAIPAFLAGGRPMPTRRFLVIHFTAGASAQSSIDWWRKLGTGVCAHLVIDRDGTVYQCRPFNVTAGHAGISDWTDPTTGRSFHNLNSCSIGIELANGGDSYPTKFSTLPPVTARHKNGGPETEWEQYTPAQLAACSEISKLLVDRYHLDDVVGHDDIAPSRKTDPGPAFPMGDLREHCGFPRKIG